MWRYLTILVLSSILFACGSADDPAEISEESQPASSGTTVSPAVAAPAGVRNGIRPAASSPTASGLQLPHATDSEANPAALSPDFGKDRSKLKRGLPDADQTAREIQQRLETDPGYIFELLEQSLGDVAGDGQAIGLDPLLMDSDPETLKKLAELLAGPETPPAEGAEGAAHELPPPDEPDAQLPSNPSQNPER